MNRIRSEDTGYYYCYYSGATDFANDKENVDSTYIYVSGKGPLCLVLEAGQVMEAKSYNYIVSIIAFLIFSIP